VILVDSKHAKQVFQQLATKPGLRKRVLIVDRDLSYEDWNRLIEPMVFEKAKMVTKPGDVVGYMMPSRYDRAMDLLGRTEDGVELLKSAQKGEDLVGGSKLKSVKLLDEYMAETEELSKIESTFITELGEVAIAAN